MTTIPELLEKVPLRDNFNRPEESPMVHAGWTKNPWDSDTGKVVAERWEEKTKPSGAYWSAASFNAPAVIAGPLWRLASSNWVTYLWAALTPGTHSGYRLFVDVVSNFGEVALHLERVAAGVGTVLGSHSTSTGGEGEPANTTCLFALAVLNGKVSVWKKVGAGAWELMIEVADATFNSGYCGLESEASSILSWDAFYAGDIEGTAPTGTGSTSIGGVPMVGEKLTTTVGEWAEPPERFTYQWQSAESEEGPWENIAGATESEFEVGAEQEGDYIRCVVTAINGLKETVAEGGVIGPIEGFVLGTLGEAHGFPDWQPWLARQPTPLYANPALVIKGEVTIGPLYVGGAAAVDAFLLQTAGNKAFKVEMLWHVGPGLVEPYLVETLSLHPTAAELHQQLPSEADHLTLRFVPLAAEGEATWRVLIQAVDDTVSERRLGANVLLSEAAIEVAKESTVQKTLARTAPGEARLSVTASGEGANRTLTLEQLGAKGEWVRYLGFVLPEKGQLLSALVTLPGSPVRFSLTNGGAAAITVDLAVGV